MKSLLAGIASLFCMIDPAIALPVTQVGSRHPSPLAFISVSNSPAVKPPLIVNSTHAASLGIMAQIATTGLRTLIDVDWVDAAGRRGGQRHFVRPGSITRT